MIDVEISIVIKGFLTLHYLYNQLKTYFNTQMKSIRQMSNLFIKRM